MDSPSTDLSESENHSPPASAEPPTSSVSSPPPSSHSQPTIAQNPEAVGAINNPEPQLGIHRTSQDELSNWTTELFDCFSDVTSCKSPRRSLLIHIYPRD